MTETGVRNFTMRHDEKFNFVTVFLRIPFKDFRAPIVFSSLYYRFLFSPKLYAVFTSVFTLSSGLFG